MQKYFIGVDLGTGSTKAVALNENGKTLATVQHHYSVNSPQHGYSEQNPTLIWLAFIDCISNITAKIGYTPTAISFSSAMHSILPVDEAGNALTDAMLWSDVRSGEIAEELRSSAYAENIYRHTGTAIYAMSPLCKIMWLSKNNPTVFNNAYKFISLKEYVWFKLFGVFEIDYSMASATGMFDILNLKWYEKSLELAGISSSRLSTIVSTQHKRSLKSGDNVAGINPSTIFVTGASDGCCANLGGNAIKPGVAALTIGTSGAVRVGSTKPVYNFNAMTFNYLLKSNVFICGGAVNNGGAALDWLLKNFLNTSNLSSDTYSQVFKEIATVKAGSEGLVFLPYLYAERAPIWDAKSSGAFININAKHQQKHFLRAALEGICFALNDVLNAVEQPEISIQEIVISGGFISSPVWVQVLADITGKRLSVLQSEDASAVGAVYLAMDCLGVDIQTIMAKDTAGRTIIEPDMEAYQLYRKVFVVYKQLYSNIRSSVHQLQVIDGL
ncbi:gluconokinase [Mucilaginibacter litoreus]|uniref:Gluconokinase n=1 Tax=Mucilaginibacter litoreus TaxID=1048221 RepID=A0ABW3ATU7_9SPHI